jgi:hypothetical protein
VNCSHALHGLVSAVTLLVGCGPEPLSVHSSQGQTLNLTTGQKLDLTVQTIGPGEYVSPPSISSPAVRFLDARLVQPYVPAGPTQLFRFEGEAPGQAIVVIRASEGNFTISDTVNVR